MQLLVVSRSPDFLAAVLRLCQRVRPSRFVGVRTSVVCERTCNVGYESNSFQRNDNDAEIRFLFPH